MSNNPRSTVGTITEIYDFFRLLYTSIGTSYCINHGDIPLKKDSLKHIVDYVLKFGEGDRFHILMPLVLDSDEMTGEQLAKRVTDIGFVRFQIGEVTYSVADPLDITVNEDDRVYVVVDRLIRKIDDNFDTRLVDSLRIALEK